MVWVMLKVFNHKNLSEVIKYAKERMDKQGNVPKVVRPTEGIGLIYKDLKLHVGYCKQRSDFHVDYYDLATIESIMQKLNSRSVAKIEATLYPIILRDNYPTYLSDRLTFKQYLSDVLDIRLSTNQYEFSYQVEHRAYVLSAYSPSLDEDDILAKIQYLPEQKKVALTVKGGLFKLEFSPSDTGRFTKSERDNFLNAIDKALETHKRDAVLQLLSGVDRGIVTVNYDYLTDKVQIKSIDTQQIRLEGYVAYGKSYGTNNGYRFTYQEYYADGTKHPYVKSYKLGVSNYEDFQEVLSNFTQNIY